MAKTLNIAGLTINPKEATEFKQFIVEQIFGRPELKMCHNVVTGVKMKEQIVFASQLGKTGIKADSSTDRKSSGATSTLTQKYWEPIGIEDSLINSQSELNSLFKAYFDKIVAYKEKYDMTGSEEEVFVSLLLEDAALANVWRAAWFGDTSVAEAGATTAGLIAAGDVASYDYFDGIFAQIFDGVTAGQIKRYTITENTPAGTPKAIVDLTADRAKEILGAVYKNADSRLKGANEAQFYVDGQTFEAYVDYLESKGVVYDINLLQMGLQSVSFKGKKVINMGPIWDSSMADFVNNSTDGLAYLPYRVVLSTAKNLPVGTLNENDFNTFDSFYDKVTRKNYMDYGFSLDSKVGEEYLISVGY